MMSARPVRIDADGPAFPAKTPGREMGRLENSIATTVRRRGKNILVPKTPLHPNSAQSKRLFKDQKSVLGTATRPLGDKTPLPNRILIPQSPSETGKMKRPSSLRKHLKLPRNSAQKYFETPMNQGRHWELSDGDIDISDLQPVLQEVKIVEDDIGSDEIEYCAPNTLDLPYQPPFDFELPDYTEVGKKIRDLAFSIPFDDAPGPPDPEFPVNELESIAWETFPLPPLESEDPFTLARFTKTSLPKTSISKPVQQQTDSLSHRRVQSSLAFLGSASIGVNRSKITASSKAVITSAPLRKQPPKSASDLETRTSKLLTTTRTLKPTIQTRNAAATVQQNFTTGVGPNRSRTRPHTSLSLASKNKTTTLIPPKCNNSLNPQILNHQVVDEDFMFEV